VITVLLVWNSVSNVSLNVQRGVPAPVVLIPSFIYAFGCFTVMVFLFWRSTDHSGRQDLWAGGRWVHVPTAEGVATLLGQSGDDVAKP
jgi:hypothetical protein